MPRPFDDRARHVFLLECDLQTAESASIELGVSSLAQRRVERSLQRRLAVVFQRYQSARVQAAKHSRDILPRSKPPPTARIGYEGGEFDFHNLLMNQWTYAQTNLDYVEALRALWSAALEMEGLLLAESLEAGR